MKAPVIGTVYLIHFDKAFGHAKHYLGWVHGDNIDQRMALHLSGAGSKLIRYVNEAGIKWSVVRLWPGKDRHYERMLNGRGKSSICPVCKQHRAASAALSTVDHATTS